MIIGVTGLMGSGKTSLCNEIVDADKSFKYLDVDVFRHMILVSSKSYKEELSEALNAKITSYKDLNKLIYTNDLSMQKYKSILYKYLSNYIKAQNEDLLVEWALIIQDDLQYIFDKLIIVERNIDDILSTKFSDLEIEDVKKRLELQQSLLIGKKIKIPYIIHKNIRDTINFLG